MSLQTVLDGIIEREGSTYTNRPDDRGGPTKYGITAKTLGAYRGYPGPAPAAEVATLHRADAVVIYWQLFVVQPRFHGLYHYRPRLTEQLVDFGVNSGPGTAVKCLQKLLRVDVDGVFGPETQHATCFTDEKLLNNALVAARLKLIDQWTDHDPTQKWAEEGVESRALSFFLD